MRQALRNECRRAAFAERRIYEKAIAHRCGLGVGAGEVAVERLGGVGEPERAGPLEDARRPEAAGEEDELDIGAEVDDVEGDRGGARADLAGSGGVALLARRVLAAQIARVVCQILGLHSQTEPGSVSSSKIRVTSGPRKLCRH
jgi:hypothetical protein